MCNAYNHDYSCPCGFGPGNGGGGWRRQRFFVVSFGPLSGGWSRDHGGTVASYVNPNAHCPVCEEVVFFYRSPYNGRVFFDELGWPWPKHGCTDNSREPKRATRESVPKTLQKAAPTWRRAGWEPLVSSKIYRKKGLLVVTGDFKDSFVELQLVGTPTVDRDSPIFARETGQYDQFEVTFLRSDLLGTKESRANATCVARIPYSRPLSTAAGLIH
jgi:hypothetical protein